MRFVAHAGQVERDIAAERDRKAHQERKLPQLREQARAAEESFDRAEQQLRHARLTRMEARAALTLTENAVHQHEQNIRELSRRRSPYSHRSR
jgi:chromosome segregation ATPase